MRKNELAALAYVADYCPDPIEIDKIVQASLDRLETEPDRGGPEATLYFVLCEKLHAMCRHRGAVPPDSPGRRYLAAIIEQAWATAGPETLELFSRINPEELRRSALEVEEELGPPVLPHLIRCGVRDQLAGANLAADVELVASWIV